MPATSKRQQRYMGAVLGRKRTGKSLRGDPKMTESQLSDFAKKKKKGISGMLLKHY